MGYSGSCKPPPPPERRNSTITSATPNAPSVAELRAARSLHADYATSNVSDHISEANVASRYL